MKTNCQQCGKEFDSQRSNVLSGRTKYCSRECSAEGRKRRVTKYCQECGLSFEVVVSHSNQKYCSTECAYAVKSRAFRKESVPWYKGGPVEVVCHTCGKIFEVNIARKETAKYCSRECHNLSQRGVSNSIPTMKDCEICGSSFRVIPSRYHLVKYCSMSCYGKARSLNYSGKNCPAWRGGVTEEMRLLRGGSDYVEWRDAVYRRDYWTCQCCGEKPKSIVAHHIFPFADFPDLRYEVWNGITLCRSCHAKEHQEQRYAAQYGTA